MIRPPIVGVPALAWCSCGPSSRMCWPNSLTRRYSMNLGPRKMQISIAAMPAISTSPMSGRVLVAPRGLQQLPQRLGHGLEAGGARALDQDRVAGFGLRGEPAQPPPRACRAARPGHSPRAGSPTPTSRSMPLGTGALADLTVVAGGAGAELGHLAEHRDPSFALERSEVARARRASRPGWRCSSRSQGRFRRPSRGARPGSVRSLCSQRDRPSRRAARPAPHRPRWPPARSRGCGPRRRGTGRPGARPGVSISASVTPSATRLSTAKTSPPGPKRSSRGAVRQVRLQLAGVTGTTAVPSVGSAASTSALAAAIASTEPSSSTWTGPTLVITATSGSAISASSAIWPAPRIAISRTKTSVSSGASSTVSGSPISVLRFSRLACTRPGSSARAMSLTEVLPTEPVTPTTRAPSARRQV